MPHSEKSLFQLTSFRLALWAPILLAFITVTYIYFTSDLTFQKGFKGLNSAWEIFKIPLAIFSLIFPSIALVTANHRSIQSKKQIELTQKNIELSTKQNSFKNYYDSIYDFEKYLDSFTLKKHLIYRNKRALYRRFFPKNTPKTVEMVINGKVLSEIKAYYQRVVDDALENLITVIEKDDISSKNVLINLYKNLRGNWLINYGLEANIELKDNNALYIEVIDNVTDEFYSLLSYCMQYSQSEIGIVISTHQSFINSPSWLLFKDKFEKHFNIDLNAIRFDNILGPTYVNPMIKK